MTAQSGKMCRHILLTGEYLWPTDAIVWGVIAKMATAPREGDLPSFESSDFGGGTRSALWRQIIGDVTGLAIEVPAEGDASCEAALVAGVGIGVFRRHDGMRSAHPGVRDPDSGQSPGGPGNQGGDVKGDAMTMHVLGAPRRADILHGTGSAADWHSAAQGWFPRACSKSVSDYWPGP